MTDLITQKSITTQIISPQTAYKSFAVTTSNNAQEKKEATPALKASNKNLSEKQQKWLSAGLITGGGLLLYYGFTRPGKTQAFDKYIQGKIFNMEFLANRYRSFVQDIVGSSFVETAEHIAQFRKTRFLNPSDSIIQIKMLQDPEKLADAQDLAFDAILNLNRSRHKQGASEFGEFMTKFNEILRRVTGEINREKHRTSMELDDYLHMPKIKEEFSPNQVEEAENKLIIANRSIDSFMEELRDMRLHSVTKQQFTQMADSIVFARELQTKTKQNIINTTFEKVKMILNLGDDFVPLYNRKTYDIGTIEEIAHFLKPQKIPANIQKQTEPNIYLETVIKEDLTNLSEEQLEGIFYRTPYENNLKDLRYMIDRYRLRYAVSVAQKSENAPIYEGIIVKLQYLSNKLNEFGKGKLLERCQKDFDKMSVEQRKASLYYISSIARRLGYDSMEAMDKDMTKTSSVYRELSLRTYMPLIKENPELYFVE